MSDQTSSLLLFLSGEWSLLTSSTSKFCLVFYENINFHGWHNGLKLMVQIIHL